MARRLRHDDYTVSWVCALPTELAAAQEMLDEQHDNLPPANDDPNIYTLGRIGKHNVVLACLPAGQTGTNASASVAIYINSTFRAIRFGFIVGIGGGVPRESVDIRLGDIVVSQPGKGHGGVIQFDFGKSKPNEFERTGFLNSPPPILLSAVSKLQAKHKQSKIDLISYISKPGKLSEFDRDKAGDDILFEGAYDHVGGNTCASCDKVRILQRNRRTRDTPEVHYGAIASGNQVMRDGKTRDKISSEFGGVLCFEMEAAGLMNSFPCLVIRGICDYADSHKNKRWQSYAAITAAAYAKELLEIIPADDVTRIPRAEGAAKERSQALGIHYDDTAIDLGRTTPCVSSLLDLEVVGRPEWKVVLAQYSQSQKIHICRVLTEAGIPGADLLESLSNYNYQRHYSRQASKRLEGTAEWILTEPDFESWLYNKQPQCLWLTGIIGSGKSVTLASMANKTSIEAQKRGTPVLHYFFHHSYRQHLTARSLFESYAKQLLHYLQRIQKPCPPDVIGQIVEFYAPKKRPPSLNEVIDWLILPLLTTTTECTFIVDGLDECNTKEVQEVLRVFKKLLGTPSRRVLVACREEVDIIRSISDAVRIRITPERTKADMEVFIDYKLDTMQCSRQISESENMLIFIKRELMKKADRMFLWAELQIQLLWNSCSGEDAVDDTIYRSLQQLPDELNDIYRTCFQKANQDERTQSLANRALKLICAAVEPFKVSQLREALAIDPKTGEMKSDPVQRGALLACCASFISLDIDSGDDLVLLAHASVRQFLLTSPGDCDSAELELGELCITHLHRHMPVRNLTIYNQGFSRERLLIPTNIPSTITKSVLPRLFQARNPISSNVSWVGLLAPARPANLTFDSRSFKYYAKEQWTSLTRRISTSSPFHSEFERVALSNNKAWWIFPWKRYYDSHNSHVAAIYGWSIMYSHYGLLTLAIDQQSKVDKSIYRLPLYNWAEIRTWLPFQAAAKTGDIKVAELLLKILPRKELEVGQPSPLLIAITEGHELMRHFLYKAGVSSNLATLKGHSNLVTAIAFSPDGRRLVSGSDDTSIRLWDGETGAALAVFKAHSDNIFTIIFSPDGRQLASGSNGKIVQLWDAKMGTALATLRGHSDLVTAVAFSPDGRRLASGSCDKTIRLWDGKTGAALATLEGHSSSVRAVAFSPDGRQLAASDDTITWLWDSKTGKALATFKGHNRVINAITFSPDGRRLASGSSDTTIRLWDSGL